MTTGRRRFEPCIVCGAPPPHTAGMISFIPGEKVALRCHKCENAFLGKKRRGKGKTVEAILEYLKDGKERDIGEISEAIGKSREVSGITVRRLAKYGFVSKVRYGVYQKVSE